MILLWNMELLFKRSLFSKVSLTSNTCIGKNVNRNKCIIVYRAKLLKYRIHKLSVILFYTSQYIMVHMQARSWCSLVAQQMEISKFCFKTTFLWNEIFFMLYSRLFFSVGDWCWPVLGPHDRGRIHSFWGEGRLW